LRLFGRRFIFTIGNDLNTALKEANFVFYNRKKLKDTSGEKFNLPKINDTEIKMAYICSVDTLRSMYVNEKGLFAGLPWFFQFWSRDELISVKALMMIGMRKQAEDLLRKYLYCLGVNHKIRNKSQAPDLDSADAIGWLFKRLDDYFRIFGKSSFSKEVGTLFLQKLIIAVDEILIYNTESGLAKNNSKETWMDTSFEGDDRSGFRIEIQALRLFIYRFMFNLTNESKYKSLELSLKRLVMKNFWNGKYLADGLNDWTIRPNTFIAYYLYPDLLDKSEWADCFKNSLKYLWLDYGGVASISKSHRLFTPSHTGEDTKSYHRGDSWFWINDLSAIAMYRVDKKKFERFIKRIITASKNEILYSGAIGRHAEVSSANELKSQGCLMQTWSSAMFIELVKEVGVK
ncbi:MAG: amylo-alpha-1,6-glucosidase, partial [Nanoarchaeota archaeon]